MCAVPITILIFFYVIVLSYVFVNRPLRFPSILVGDGRLGGISATIAAYESLKLRGYDVVAVIFEDHGLANEVPLMSYFRSR